MRKKNTNTGWTGTAGDRAGQRERALTTMTLKRLASLGGREDPILGKIWGNPRGREEEEDGAECGGMGGCCNPTPRFLHKLLLTDGKKKEPGPSIEWWWVPDRSFALRVVLSWSHRWAARDAGSWSRVSRTAAGAPWRGGFRFLFFKDRN